MQTEKTSNIIDLAELRHRRDSLAWQTGEELWAPEEERRQARRERIAWGMEIGACLSLILTAAAFALRVLL